MNKNKTNKEKPTPQDNVSDLTPDRHSYNIPALRDFLEMVIHSELEVDEEILTWISSGIPQFPLREDSFYTKLKRVPLPKALYFGTATTIPDPTDGNVYNRKTLFKRFHVLVLDDIGTKVKLSKIPELFKPTYIIESSEGNYQYGYVLAEPIEVLEQAEALIQLVYEAGYSDNGGKMATKLVRLPDGVNGKKGTRGEFKVKLISGDGPLWKPEDILEILNIGISWAEIVEDAATVIKSRANHSVGLTPWSPITPKITSLSGIIDQALEWLYDEGMVKQETNEWVTVLCPWADEHTTGNEFANYSPFGWGSSAYRSSRNFKCFHAHCAARTARDFLEFVATNNGPQVPVIEHAGHLTSEYAFDPVNNGVWKVKGVNTPRPLPLDGFRNLHPEKENVCDHTGKIIKVRATELFIQSKARVTVMGQVYDPTTLAKIVTDSYGDNWINTYTMPDWGDGVYDEQHVDTFKQFIDYLIPDIESRDFFLDWLAAKTQDMAFRGPAILMIAPEQGTGRNTLANMLTTLFGDENVEKVPFERLSRGGEGYNDWIVKPLIITDETLALNSQDNYYKVYEKLKELIDTTPEAVRINPKYGKQRFQTTYSSFILFSNHENAMIIADNDRRIYVLDNTHTPASPEYFLRLHAWLNEKGSNDKILWAKAIWRWLRVREIDLGKLLTPVNMTQAKQDMLRAGKQPIDVAIEAILLNWPCDLIASQQIKTILLNLQYRLNFNDPSKANNIMNRVFRLQTLKLKSTQEKYRVNESPVRLRMIPKKLGGTATHNDISLEFIQTQIYKMPNSGQLKQIRMQVEEALSMHDF